MKTRKQLLNTSVSILALATASVHAEIILTEQTVEAGISGNAIQSTTNHTLGACWIDYDKDSWPDLFVVNGFGDGLVAHLWKNEQDGTFSVQDSQLPILADVEMAGCRFADYDNDGDDDIFIQTHNELWSLHEFNPSDGPASILLKNMWIENGEQTQPGQPLFMEVAADAGVAGTVDVPFGDVYDARSSMTGGFLDYDRDGCVDLYVGQMILQEAGQLANMDTLYKNNCDGTFDDVTLEAGVYSGLDDTINFRPTLAFLGAQLDSDMDPDMIAISVHEPAPHFEERFLRNNGDGTFTDYTAEMPGIGDDAGSGMGIDIADIDNNGTWDIYITDVFDTLNDAAPKGNVLYLGNGDGTFADNSAPEAGVESGFSWGTSFVDVDQDGYDDLLVGTATPSLYRNNQDGTFTRVVDQFPNYFQQTKGTAIADYDRDGDLDIVTVNEGGGNPGGGGIKLYRNDTTDIGNFMQFLLTGTESNPNAIGAVVKVTTGTMTSMQQVVAGVSSHSQDEFNIHFGTGAFTLANTVTVMWPSGEVSEFSDVPAGKCYSLIEGGELVDNLCNGSVVEPEPLTVTEVTPVEVEKTVPTDITVTGTGFMPGVTIGVCASHRTPAVTNSVTFVSSTEFTANITGPGNIDRNCAVRVTNPDGTEFSLPRGTIVFVDEIAGEDPVTITGIAPNRIPKSVTTTVTVNGGNFVEGTSLVMCPNLTTKPTITNITIIDSTTLTADVLAPANAPRACAVEVSNPDGTSAVLANGGVLFVNE